ncbi:hypothetical protein [Leptolyngbya sp. FACHB-17]|uniref:hypothetical protein n=1 Tax=unclassified Leptolyngbya TaxID=2650499 RepID=UPI001680B1A8|nr:hypothetical protein [Leptolyngbya sp. FACHB-17]MBD2080291.1 hypothetical protein [Leptolyngbya sp. FACHB-17]
MPGYLVQQGATVICAHGGQAQPTVPNPRVKLGRQPTVLQTSPYTIAGCSNPPPTANVGPCTTANWTSGSMRVKSMGQPVILQDSLSVCVPTGTPLTVAVAQLRVKGI